MAGRVALAAFGLLLSLAIRPGAAAAYSDTTTHPALTEDIAALHDRLYPENPLTAEERAWMMRGSTEEDIVPRSLNHLYDPVHQVGWTGTRTGWAPETLTRLVSLLAILPDAPVANVAWLQADGLQQAYARYGGNRSWPAALRALRAGRHEEAYLDLGAALHLLEDAGVPDHARDDTHVHGLGLITGDTGSPYESYARAYAPGSRAYPKGSPKRSDVPRYGSPEAYLADNARYASAALFSKDTVQDPAFPNPVVRREANGIAYGIAPDGREVPLALRVRRSPYLAGATSSLVLGEGPEFHAILQAQLDLMAERTVLLGVGMVRDFREARGAVSGLASPQASIWSLAGELSRIGNAMADGAGSLARAGGNQLDRAYSWLSGTFSRSDPANGKFAAGNGEGQGAPVSEIKVITGKVTTPKKAAVAKSAAVKTVTVTGSKAAVPAAPAPAACPASGPPRIEISEVAWMGTVLSPNDEWIELHNLEPVGITIDSGQLASSDGSVLVDLAGVRLPASGYVVLERTDDDSVPGIAAAAVYVGALPNAPGTGYALELAYASCGVIDQVRAEDGWPAGDAPRRLTMERRADGTWQSSAAAGGTPGKQSSAGAKEQPASADKPAGKDKAPEPAAEPQENDEEERMPDEGRLTLSELQSGGTDAGDEWVELYNVEDRDVSLFGWTLQYFPASASGTSVAQKWQFPDDAVIPGRGYYLVGRGKAGDGTDGYRGTVEADATYRAFSLSGLGASIALVRGSERAATVEAPEVVDRLAYPRLGSGISFEREAAGESGCLSPLPGEEGELRGNGCPLQSWVQRAVPEPQNAGSEREPRGAGAGSALELEMVNANGRSWLSLPAEVAFGGYEQDRDGQEWQALAFVQGSGEPRETISTETFLDLGPVSALGVGYQACSGARVTSSVLAVPLTGISCQGGGPLSSALDQGYRGARRLLLEIGAGALQEGSLLRLFRYAYGGGRAGYQGFVLERLATQAYRIVISSGMSPEMPEGLTMTYEAGEARLAWDPSEDGDSLQQELTYEASFVDAAEPDDWISAGAGHSAAWTAASGSYRASVRTVDPQGNRSEAASLLVEIEEPVSPEQFDHDEEVSLGTHELTLEAAASVSGIALWVAPEGGPYCCARVRIVLVGDDGAEMATGEGARRTVDGDGEVPALFATPVSLPAGTYQLRIEPAEGNSFRLYGSGRRPYLRLVGT